MLIHQDSEEGFNPKNELMPNGLGQWFLRACLWSQQPGFEIQWWHYSIAVDCSGIS